MSQAAEILTELQRRGVIVANRWRHTLFEATARSGRYVAGPRPRSQAHDPRSLKDRPGRLRFAALCRVL